MMRKEEYTVTAENLQLKMMIPQEENKNDYLVNLTMHTHSYIEVFACISGKLGVISEKEEVFISNGEMLFMPPQTCHRLNFIEDGTKWCAFGISYSKIRANNAQDIYKIISGIFSNEFPHIYAGRKICDAIYEIANNANAYYLPALELLVILLKMSCAENNPFASEFDIVCRLEHIIDSGFMNRLNGDIIAEKLNISTRQLSRIVKKRYGISLHAVITHKRLEAAAKMLEKTDHSAEAICCEVGFSNKNSFFREFGKLYGMSPIRYRTLLWGSATIPHGDAVPVTSARGSAH